MKTKASVLAKRSRDSMRTLLWLGFFATIVVASNTYAQNGDAEGKLDKKKYMFELAKNWSFGYENYKNKQYDRAAKYFWVVARLDTIDKFPKVYRYLGDSYFKLENPDSAQLVFESGLEKYPKDTYLHRMIGFLKAQREQVDEAIIEYETVVAQEPESKDDWKQLAALYAKADRDDDAIAAYDSVLAIDPHDLEAQNNQAALIGRTGDISGLIEKKEVIRQQDPENSQVRYELGELYFREGEYEKSIALFKEFLSLSGGDVAAIEYIANSYRNLEQTQAAIKEFKKILALQPDNKKMMAEISRGYKELGSFQSAKTYANKALRVDRRYGFGWIVLGEAYEGSAEICVNKKNGSVDFSDKLIYELARQQYRRAFQDLEFRQEAERHISFLQTVLPTKEDVFMHRRDKRPETDCYTWIPDSAFGDSFWRTLNARLK
ncbi:MAG: tetratricopeptide repeat protein [bacterium]